MQDVEKEIIKKWFDKINNISDDPSTWTTTAPLEYDYDQCLDLLYKFAEILRIDYISLRVLLSTEKGA